MKGQISDTIYRNQAAQRVLIVLRAFIGSTKAMSIAELSDKLGFSSSLTRRALTTLAAAGYVVPSIGGSGFQLGYRLLELNGDNVEEPDIRQIGHNYLEALHQLTGESVGLSIVVGQSRVMVDKIEGKGRRVTLTERGVAVPLHVGPGSRSLLACLPDQAIEAYLRTAPPMSQFVHLFPSVRDQTSVDIWRDIQKTRENGYIVWASPELYSATFVAIPIQDEAGYPHGTITIGAPAERVDVTRMEQLLPSILEVITPLREQCALFAAPPVFLFGSNS